MGSKNRHAKEILPIILKERKKAQWYIEPFVGGFNIIDKVVGNRIGNDSHYYLIKLFEAVQRGWKPPDHISEKTYKALKTYKKYYNPYLVGFAGFGCSYSGKWFGGYARGNDNNGNPRNYTLESKRNILKQVGKIKSIIISNSQYQNMYIPPDSVIYCDPPYRNTTKYTNAFNSDKFWDWSRHMSRQGHNVFVSEYSAPKDFKVVWEKRVNNTLEKNTGGKTGTEKLFTI